ncbi:MAG: hypothetical protein WCI74_17230, partial [Actinomycetes bacterium]
MRAVGGGTRRTIDTRAIGLVGWRAVAWTVVLLALAGTLAAPCAAYADVETVWRFRSTSLIGSYLWTANPSEKAATIADDSGSWIYEGPSFVIDTANHLNNTPLWRFRNRQDWTYFYTADPAEKEDLVQNFGATWDLEGPAWNVCAVPSTFPVWRFRCLSNSTHLWTADPAEKAAIEKSLQSSYEFEGIAYYIAGATKNVPDPATGFLLNGRQLVQQGTQVTLGNFPTGGAVTSDGRYLWTVSTGQGRNDVRIVDTTTKSVIQTIQVPGASGGVALDSAHNLAYVSGIMVSRWWPSLDSLPGVMGNCILVYSWSPMNGQAHIIGTIPVNQCPTAPLVQEYPVATPDTFGSTNAWPQKLAVSPDGSKLLVPLNLADSAALVSLAASPTVQYVSTGSGTYPFGAAITPDGRIGLVSNEGSGTVTVIDMNSGAKLHAITVGPPLSHPQGIVIDPAGARAYVALTNLDQVVVIDLSSWTVERTLAVGRAAGLGTKPVALSISPDGSRLYVAEAGTDSIAVIRLPGSGTT